MPSIESKETMWIDDCRKIERFHKEKIKTHGKHKKVIGGYRGENNGWSVRKTAKALNLSVGKVSENLNLAQAIRDYPNIKEFSDRVDALLFLKVKKNG